MNMLRSILAMLLFLIASHSHAKQFVVIESTAKNISVGAMLSPEFVVSLRNQEQLTVIAQTGQAHVVKGPYRGALGAINSPQLDAANLSLALGRLINQRKEDTSTLGTVRRLGASTEWLTAQDNQTWRLISAEHDGVQCIVPGQPVLLIRKDSQVFEQAQLRAVDGENHTLQWEKGQSSVRWPAQVPFADGRVYLLRRNGSSIPYRLQLRELDSEFATTAVEYQLATLLARNCAVQAAWVTHAKN